MSSQIILPIANVFNFQIKTTLQLKPKINQNKTKKKLVRFSEICKVILIPTRHEYLSAGIILWWSKNDFKFFKQNYLFENQCKINDSTNQQN